MEDNHISVTIQNLFKQYQWYTAEDKSCMNASITFPYFDYCALTNEGNVYGVIVAPEI